MENSSPVLWQEYVRGGDCWSHILKRGTSLRIIDEEGGANAPALFFNAHHPAERYNMPDTLKAQHTAHLTRGFVLYSDMGRVLCSVTDDTCGWHDPLGGHMTSSQSDHKYGRTGYQQVRNEFHRNSRDNFLIEMAKYGLGRRDLSANLNFFSKIVVDLDGALRYIEGHSKPGSCVELRAEMDALVILDTCQHPLDPEPGYHPKPLQLEIRSVPPAGPDDFCRHFRPENARGFLNTERYLL